MASSTRKHIFYPVGSTTSRVRLEARAMGSRGSTASAKPRSYRSARPAPRPRPRARAPRSDQPFARQKRRRAIDRSRRGDARRRSRAGSDARLLDGRARPRGIAGIEPNALNATVTDPSLPVASPPSSIAGITGPRPARSAEYLEVKLLIGCRQCVTPTKKCKITGTYHWYRAKTTDGSKSRQMARRKFSLICCSRRCFSTRTEMC